MIRRPPRSTPLYSSAASDVYKRQGCLLSYRPVQIPNHELLVRRTCHPIRSRRMWVPLDIGDFPRRTVGKEPRRCIQVIEVQYIQPRFGAKDDFLVRRTQTHASHRLVDINDGRCQGLGSWSRSLRHGQEQGSILTFLHTTRVFMAPSCGVCLLYTSPSPRDGLLSRMPSSA